MGVVLAIDPGGRHARTIDRLTREFQDHEVIVAASGDEALDLFESRLPDLLVFPLFMAPGDESRMEAELQGLSAASDHRTLSIPLRAFLHWERDAIRPAAVPPRWFYWFRPSWLDVAAPTQVHVFIETLRADVNRPRAVAAVAVPTIAPGAAPPPDVHIAAAPVPDPAVVVDPVAPFSGEAVDVAELLPPEPSRELVLTRPELVVDIRRRSVFASVWRLPRTVQVGVPAAAILLTLGVSGVVGTAFSPARWLGAARERWSSGRPQTGTTELQTMPEGVQVWYQGQQLGVTPLRTELPAGEHEVELRHRNAAHTVRFEVTAGTSSVQMLEWPPARASGALHVDSDPPGAAVSVDGKPRGTTPLNVGDLAVGRHLVEVTLNGNSVHESVEVAAGKTATLRTSIYQGWLALFSAIELTVAAGGRALTLDDQNRVMLPSGRHQLTLQNRALGYSATHTVDIKPGSTTPFSVQLPKTTLTVTTSSSADILIDGEAVGPAPVTEVAVEIGTRQITARSTEHGERHATVIATTAPVSVAIDFATPAP